MAFRVQVMLVMGMIDLAMAAVCRADGVRDWYDWLVIAGWCWGWAGVWMYTARKGVS